VTSDLATAFFAEGDQYRQSPKRGSSIHARHRTGTAIMPDRFIRLATADGSGTVVLAARVCPLLRTFAVSNDANPAAGGVGKVTVLTPVRVTNHGSGGCRADRRCVGGLPGRAKVTRQVRSPSPG
jgi:hypothetical protein